MSRRRSEGSALVVLWLLAALAGGIWIWLSNMDGQCNFISDGPTCTGQVFGNAFSPLVGWIAVFLAALAVIASLITLARRAFR